MPQVVVSQPEVIEGSDAEILDQDVGAIDEALQRVACRALLQIERNAALVAVHHHERAGLARDLGRDEAAGVVAAGYLLDLDDVGAHVGQQHARRRP